MVKVNKTSREQIERVAKYNAENTRQFPFRLFYSTEKLLIEYLDTVDNRAGLVKQLLANEMLRNGHEVDSKFQFNELEKGRCIFKFVLLKKDTLTSNDRLHFRDVARRASALRKLASKETVQPLQSPVRVTVTVQQDTARRFDPANWYPTVKPLIDGLVDAGILSDDDSKNIEQVTFTHGQTQCEKGHTVIILSFEEI